MKTFKELRIITESAISSSKMHHITTGIDPEDTYHSKSDTHKAEKALKGLGDHARSQGAKVSYSNFNNHVGVKAAHPAAHLHKKFQSCEHQGDDGPKYTEDHPDASKRPSSMIHISHHDKNKLHNILKSGGPTFEPDHVDEVKADHHGGHSYTTAFRYQSGSTGVEDHDHHYDALKKYEDRSWDTSPSPSPKPAPKKKPEVTLLNVNRTPVAQRAAKAKTKADAAISKHGPNHPKYHAAAKQAMHHGAKYNEYLKKKFPDVDNDRHPGHDWTTAHDPKRKPIGAQGSIVKYADGSHKRELAAARSALRRINRR